MFRAGSRLGIVGDANNLISIKSIPGCVTLGRAYKLRLCAVVNEKPFVQHKLDGRCTKGLNPDKTNWAQKIDTPPYWGYTVVCGLTMTYGGLKVNEKAQVIDTSDRPIKGLYAVGEVTGGFFYHNYLGATGLIRGAVFGMIAGSEAASNI